MYPALPVQRPAGPAGPAGAAFFSPGRDPRGAIGARPDRARHNLVRRPRRAARRRGAQDQARSTTPRRPCCGPELISGAPPNVVTAVMRAQEILDTAWQVLGDPESRRRYDEAVGLRRSGGGLGQPGTSIESARLAPADLDIIGELPGVTGWLGPRRRRNRPGAVPDVRGLFYHVCLEVATRHGLHVMTVRLTERPMAVDGLVVDQDPRPSTKAHRGGKLTVQVWHPPARGTGYRTDSARRAGII